MKRIRIAASCAIAAAIVLALASCGGSGENVVGSNCAPEDTVCTGFLGNLNFQIQEGEGEGIGEGADGDGGIGAGGALGQFRDAMVVVTFPDGTELGRARTDRVRGMVTIRPGRNYTGPLFIEIIGDDQAAYFEEGKNEYVPFPAGNRLRVLVPRVTQNIGVTPFTEAAYQLAVACQGGSVAPLCGSTDSAASPSDTSGLDIASANSAVLALINQLFPASLRVNDITRLPFIVSEDTGPGEISTTERDKYGLVNLAFSKQAAMYNTNASAPTLLAMEQLSQDLLDGNLDGRNGAQRPLPAALRTYDPHTLTTELTAALAQQAAIYGDDKAQRTPPPLTAFGNVRYDSYFFDARIESNGTASTIAVGTETDSTKRVAGEVEDYVRAEGDRRAFMVYGNMGSGSLFIKTDSLNSQSEIRVVGDNLNGELGTGNDEPSTEATTITLPGVVTHAAGGFGHTTVRLADGRVYAFGDNEFGQLGRSPLGLRRSRIPVLIDLPAGAVAVGASNAASFALLEDGRVYSWGASWGFGTLGDGQADSIRTTPAPVLIAGGGELTQVVQLSARDNDVIVLKADGTVLSWGSFSQDAPDVIRAAIVPGRTVATPIRNLPQGQLVRKILTEQGLFVAMIGGQDEAGAVYSWGVHFDLSADGFLFDRNPQRVLNLPPVRDLMPGGFQGYGVRPFDRLTAMGVDYVGRYWKIRGRVAERYDPADPTAQRRPQGLGPRPDCASCHTVRPASVEPPPSTGQACVLPGFKLRNDVPVLASAGSDCTGCHNGNRLNNGTGAILAILDCVVPPLPPRQNVEGSPKTKQCQLPPVHPPAPTGTFCATCHNSVIVPALDCLANSGPTLPATSNSALITGAQDNVGNDTGNISSGQTTDDNTPLLTGTTARPLASGDRVSVLRDGQEVGDATMISSSAWTYQSAVLPDGTYRFNARVIAANGSRGEVSDSEFSLVIQAGVVIARQPAFVKEIFLDQPVSNNVLGITGILENLESSPRGTMDPILEITVTITGLSVGDQVELLDNFRVVMSKTVTSQDVQRGEDVRFAYAHGFRLDQSAPTMVGRRDRSLRVRVNDAGGNRTPSTGQYVYRPGFFWCDTLLKRVRAERRADFLSAGGTRGPGNHGTDMRALETGGARTASAFIQAKRRCADCHVGDSRDGGDAPTRILVPTQAQPGVSQ